MEKHVALALSQMGESLENYNKGVLTALGHESLFRAWSSAKTGLALAVDARDAAEAAAADDKEMAFGEFPAVDPALHASVNEQRARVYAAWAPIEALKVRAIETRSAADPLGLGQAI